MSSRRERPRSWGRGAVAGALLALCATSAGADVCSVPGTFSSIGQAVASATCTQIVLGPATFVEDVTIDRTVQLTGSGVGTSIVRGRIRARGGGVLVEIGDLTVDTSGCVPTGLEATDGASTQTTVSHELAVVDGGGPCPFFLFADGFESGNVSAWSGSAP